MEVGKMRGMPAVVLILAFSFAVYGAAYVELTYPAEGSTVQMPVVLEYSYHNDGSGPSSVSCTGYLGGIQVTQPAELQSNGTATASFPDVPGQNALLSMCTGADFAQNITRTFAISAPATPAIALVAPSEGERLGEGGTDFVYIYKANGGPASANCSLDVDLGIRDVRETYDGETNYATLASLWPGEHQWAVECSAGGSTYYSELRTFYTPSPPPQITLASPANNAVLASKSADLIYEYLPNGNPDSVSCTLRLDEQPLKTTTLYSGMNEVVHVDNLAAGQHMWTVLCDYQQTSIPLGPSYFAVPEATSPQVVLGQPANGKAVRTTVTFTYTYQVPEGSKTEQCVLFIDSAPTDTRNVQSGALQSVTVSGIPEGLHSWKAECGSGGAKASSETRSFWAVSASGSEVVLFSPENSATFAFGSPVSFKFAYFAQEERSSAVMCRLFVDGEERGSRMSQSDSTQTITISGLGMGPHSWKVTCLDGAIASPAYSFSFVSQPSFFPPPPGSSGGVIGGGGSGGSSGGGAVNRSAGRGQTSTAVNQSNPPTQEIPPSQTPQVGVASLYAPAEGYVNASVQIALTTQGGRPLSGASVLVRMPDGTTIRMLTDSNGRASYAPPYEGIYTYRATGYSLSGSPQTRVRIAPYQKGSQEDWLSAAAANALPFIAVLAIVALAAGAYVFLTKKPEE